MCERSDIFKAFRQQIHDGFEFCADSLLNLIDSLSGRQNAQSVAELSLEPLFDRKYSSLYKAISSAFVPENKEEAAKERQKKALEQVKSLLPAFAKPSKHPFWLTAIDATPALRPYSNCLADRSITYYPNPAPGNKPIGVGHSYSMLALLPERQTHAPPWVVPLSCQRITTRQSANEVAAKQMTALLSEPGLPFGIELTVNAGDSGYSKAHYLGPVSGFPNHVEVVRAAKNRKFFQVAATPEVHPGHVGRPKKFGVVFDLKDETTWGAAVEKTEIDWQTASGRPLKIKLQRWNTLLMRGKKNIPMHEHPFDLVRARVFDLSGKLVFARSMWLIVMGNRRAEISTVAAYEAYRQRYDLEHFFRFGKNKLLMDSFQTPTLEHEENWWCLACLAYVQLWLAAHLCCPLPKPWERYLPEFKEHRLPSPSQVQRDYGRIIRQFGTPACPRKPRGNSPGRPKGASQCKRKSEPIVFKRSKPSKVVTSG